MAEPEPEVSSSTSADPPPTAEPEPEKPADPPPRSGPEGGYQPASYVLFGIVAAITAALDLVSKEWATKKLTGPARALADHDDFVLIKDFFELRYARNAGGAWSALSDLPEIWRRPFFLFVSTAASVFIMSIYARIDRRDWAMKWGLPLALGGAVGNLVDRVRHGYVVDFLHAFVIYKGQRKTWPTFNVADVWIVMGVGLMAISLFFGRSRLTMPDHDDDEAGDPEPKGS